MPTVNEEKFVNKFLDNPFFSRLINESGYKSVGIKIVKNHKIINEVTSSYNKKKIKLSKGIVNPDFTIAVNYKFLKSLDKRRTEWIKENPLKAYFRYKDKVDLPFFVKLKILSMIKDEY